MLSEERPSKERPIEERPSSMLGEERPIMVEE